MRHPARQAFIISGVRSAVVPEGGAFARLALHDLAAPVLQACLDRAAFDPDHLDEVILSNALYGGGNPARMAVLAAGLPERIAGLSTDRQCVGGMDAVLLAARMVQSGLADAVLAGGAESHSRRPIRMATDPEGGAPVAYDRPPFSPFPANDPDMHPAAGRLAERFGISRKDMDAFAVESHRKALAARNRLSDEIVEINGVVEDRFTRQLSPALCERAKVLAGGITAANAAVSADAAAFVLVVSDNFATQDAVRFVDGETLGGATDLPGIAPVAAVNTVLQRTGLKADDVGVSEIMEAYAVQAMVCQREAGLDPATLNIGGGALARGHPIGASGAVNLVRLLHELQRKGGKGLGAIAAAGGLGTAVVLEA